MTRKNDGAGQVGVRDGERNHFFLLTTLYSMNGEELGKGRVRNLSSTGMLVEYDVDLAPGTKLGFTLKGLGDLTGQVVRADAGHVGVRFDQEIDPMQARRPVGGVRPNRARPQTFRN